MTNKLINQGNDWTSESLDAAWTVIARIAKEKYGMTWYKPRFEIVSFEEMLQVYAGSMPIMFDHWSFGKNAMQMSKAYHEHKTNLAYEVVFNTNPSVCYLMENNSFVMQLLVMCHAAIGHSAFFMNNELFKENTNAGTILPYLRNVKEFVSQCETKYGDRVEHLLDMCTSLQCYAIDRSPEVIKTRKQVEDAREARKQAKLENFRVDEQNVIGTNRESIVPVKARMREENILKFIALNSPVLKDWERELILMFCKIQQYFFPQRLTKLMNEGYASFWHYQLMNDLLDEGYIDDGQMLEFLVSHTSVVCQHDHDSRNYSGLNPYKLGYGIFNDIKRICEEPDEEDKRLFPDLVGKNWVEEVKFAAYNFKDESFITQYLSPKVVRELKLFNVHNNAESPRYLIDEVHDDLGFKKLRANLAQMFNFQNDIPDIYVEGWDKKKTRKLYIKFQSKNNRNIAEESIQAVDNIYKLWGFTIDFRGLDERGEMGDPLIYNGGLKT